MSVDHPTWVSTILTGLSLRRKIGQLLCPMFGDGADGSVAEWAEAHGLGGMHYFGGRGAEETWKRLQEVQAAVSVPLLISGDLDRAGERIAEGTVFQSQMALGAAGSEDLAYRLGEAIAVQNLAVGYNWTFSPIVDMCGIRDHLRHIAAISDDPEVVARLACAQIRGIQDHGMAACAKHFPGDGYDDRDQHLTTSVNPLSEEEWYRKPGYTFRKAIEAGVWSIMNSLIACPALDPDAGDPRHPRPGVISRELTTGILREKLGFDGVIVTDALNMGGLASHLPIPERYVQAFEAGNDMLLFVRKPAETIHQFERCVEEGRISEERIDASVSRILQLKAKIGLADVAVPENPEPLKTVTDSRWAEDARKLAEQSLTLLSDRQKRVPFTVQDAGKTLHVLITNRAEEFEAEVFNETLRCGGMDVEMLINPETEPLYDRVAAGEFRTVITSLYFPIQWGWVTPRAHGPHIRTIMSGYHLAHPDLRPVFISWGSPFHLYEMAFMDPFLVTYGNCSAAQEAAARALLGKIPIHGRVPVGLKGFFERGDGEMRDVLPRD